MKRKTHHLVQALQIVGDDLWLGSVYEARLLLLHIGVLVVALLVPGISMGPVRRLILRRYLPIYLPLHLDQHRRQHTEFRAPPRHLQQTEDHVSLVLAHNQVVGLE